MKQKKQEGGFLGALLAPLAASLVQPAISSVVKGTSRGGVTRAGEIFLVPLHPLNNIKITNYFNNEPVFNGVFSRNSLPRTDRAYVINFDDKNSKGTHWDSLFIHKNVTIYFDSFGIEYIPQEVLNKIRDKSITHSIFRIQ